MKRDVADHVRFCPVQSALGQKLLAEHGAPYVGLLMLVECNCSGVYNKSDTILEFEKRFWEFCSMH